MIADIRKRDAEFERLREELNRSRGLADRCADERDAAIELARRLAHSERFIDYADAVEEFDKRYGDQPAQTPTCEPLPPASDAIEYLRSPRYPGLIFGQIVSTGGTVECAKLWIDPACVESGPWEMQVGGVWRAI